MNPRTFLFVLVVAFGCDKTTERATDHLAVLGFRNAACDDEGHGEAFCTVDGLRFRCTVVDSGGCGKKPTACERFFTQAVPAERAP